MVKKRSKKHKKKADQQNDAPVPIFLKIPAAENAEIMSIQKRCRREHRLLNRTEIFRAGLKALQMIPDEDLQKIVDELPLL